MAKYKIVLNRKECIECGSCEAAAPELFEMDKGDNKSNLKGGKKLKDGKEELEIDESKLESTKEAANVCPANVISIVDSKGKPVE